MAVDDGHSARKSAIGVRANQGIKQRQSKRTEEKGMSSREHNPGIDREKIQKVREERTHEIADVATTQKRERDRFSDQGKRKEEVGGGRRRLALGLLSFSAHSLLTLATALAHDDVSVATSPQRPDAGLFSPLSFPFFSATFFSPAI